MFQIDRFYTLIKYFYKGSTISFPNSMRGIKKGREQTNNCSARGGGSSRQSS